MVRSVADRTFQPRFSFFFEQDANWEPTSGIVDTHGRCYLYEEPVEVLANDDAPEDCGARKDTFLKGIIDEPGWRYGSIGAVLLGDCRRLPRKEGRRCVSLEAPAEVNNIYSRQVLFYNQ